MPTPEHPAAYAVRVFSVWEDRGVRCVVLSVSDDGGAVVRLASGEKLTVRPSFFSRSRKVKP